MMTVYLCVYGSYLYLVMLQLWLMVIWWTFSCWAVDKLYIQILPFRLRSKNMDFFFWSLVGLLVLSTVNTFELSSVGSDHFLFDEIFLVSKLMLLELCLLIFPLKFILFYFVGVLTSNCYPSFTLFLLHVNIYLFFHFLSSAPYSFLVGCYG